VRITWLKYLFYRSHQTAPRREKGTQWYGLLFYHLSVYLHWTGKCIRLGHIVVRVEADNRTLRMEKEALQGETVATDHGSMTEADEEGPSKKRRGDVRDLL